VIELERPRDTGALFVDALGVYRRHFWTFLALGALVVVPAELVVSGLGLEQFSAGYDSTPRIAEAVIPAAVTFLVVGPLVTAICIHALRAVATGGAPGAREAIVNGFESFAPIFLAVLLAALGIVLGLVLIVPGIFLFVRWYFVPQAVVIERTHGVGALSSSGRLVDGGWWRAFGLILLVNLVALLVSVVLGAPFAGAAQSSDRAVWALVGSIVAGSLTHPFAALYSTLLYYDLRARKSAFYRP